MDHKPGAQISRKAFVQSVVILLLLMLVAGILTQVIPAGSYQRSTVDGREMVDPGSFQLIERPTYPIWRWVTAPAEVLWGPDGVTIITIAVFILLVGASFAVLDRSGIMQASMANIVKRFGSRRYLLLLSVSLFFMLIGALFGIFEEVVPLVPVVLGLSYLLGWDSMVGLGMSILATNMGFSAAIMNPFTIGVAQKIAGLPLFSGAWFRVGVFIVVYAVFSLFLVRYAKRVERNPEASPVFEEDRESRSRYASLDLEELAQAAPHLRRGIIWFGVFFGLILIMLIAGPFVPAISGLTLPLVGLLFLIGGIGAGLAGGSGCRLVWSSALQGIAGIAPGIPLILMAASVKHIVAHGGVMDTILHSASGMLGQTSPIVAAILVYALALLIEFFVASGSAKAFLLMPILLPLADLVGLTRQVAVTAYTFGDGFSNMAYPTNPVLLICLGLTVVSYPKWLKWSLKLWGWMLLVTVALLALAVAINLGPF